MKKIRENISNFSTWLSNNKTIAAIEGNFVPKEANAEPSELLQTSEFYQSYESATVSWKLKQGDENDLRFTGSLKMLSSPEIVKDWKGIVYFGGTAEDDPKRLFKPVDLFSGDACAGLYTNDPSNTMHLYLYEGKPNNLQLSIDGYISMALDFKCFYFWQYIILSFQTKQSNEVAHDYAAFCESRPDFPSLGEMEALFNQRKI